MHFCCIRFFYWLHFHVAANKRPATEQMMILRKVVGIMVTVAEFGGVKWSRRFSGMQRNGIHSAGLAGYCGAYQSATRFTFIIIPCNAAGALQRHCPAHSPVGVLLSLLWLFVYIFWACKSLRMQVSPYIAFQPNSNSRFSRSEQKLNSHKRWWWWW